MRTIIASELEANKKEYLLENQKITKYQNLRVYVNMESWLGRDRCGLLRIVVSII